MPAILMELVSALDKAPLFDAAVALLGAVLALVARALHRLIAVYVSNATARAVLERVAVFMATEVRALDQTLVPELRAMLADGKLTPEEVGRLRAIVLDRVRRNLGPEGLARLAAVIGARGVDSYLDSLLEATVHATRQGAATAPVPAPAEVHS